MAMAGRMLEDEAVRRAHEGVRRLLTYKGKPIRIQGEHLYETTYSDSLLQFLLKAYDREGFGDKSQLDVKFPTRIEDLPVRWNRVAGSSSGSPAERS
jgi:hypothetical protein